MENQNIFVEEGQQTIMDAHLAHKLHKQERRLLERLSEAHEAEVRALERFQRAQAKLERRKARIRRLEQRISEIRAEQAELPTSVGEPVSDYGANGHTPVDTLKEDTLLSAATVDTPVPAIDPSAEEVEEDIFEPEVHGTPELLTSPAPASAIEGDNTGPALTTAGEAITEVPAEYAISSELIPTGATNADEELHQAVLQEGVTTAAPAIDDISGKSVEEAEMHQVAEPVASEMTDGSTEEMPSAAVNNEQETPADSEADITTKMEKAEQMEEEQEEQGEQAEQIEQGGQIAQTEAAQQVPLSKSPDQVLIEAREAWQMADAAVHLASNRAQDLAGSISILVQANLSGTLMEELLHKQSEANKALVEARKVARLAYEELVQAEEVYRAAQS